MNALAAELAALDATAQAELVRRGEVTPAELVDAAIARIEALNPLLNAVVTPTFERAIDAAGASPSGPFAGVPFLLKDLACEMEGVRFTEGSRFLADNVSRVDQELVVRLRAAGLMMLGKTNTPEFGMAPACEPVLFGPTRNPWNTDRSTSGSSGGAAAAVASGMVPFAHGNDLGGSLRYPASACGLFAVKPTRARNPLGPEYGDVAGGGAVEHALTRSVRDSAALLDATSGPDVGDPYWAPPPVRPFAEEPGADPGRLRIGFTARTPNGDLGHADCVAAVEHTARLCESLGHDVFEVEWPGFTPPVGAAIGTMIQGVTAWILAYWIRHVGREPGPDEIEPLTARSGKPDSVCPRPIGCSPSRRRNGSAGASPARSSRSTSSSRRPCRRPVTDRRHALDTRRPLEGARDQRRERPVRRRRRQPHRQPGDVGAAVVERRGPPDRLALPCPLR